MKISRIKLLLAAAAVPTAAAALVLGAQGAQASTAGCTAGAYAGYCGTQINNATLGSSLVLNAAGNSAKYNTKVIGWTNSSSNKGDDWFQLPYGGNPASGVEFVYAPHGLISNMCAADPGNNKVVLRPCNGSNFQRWVATSTDYRGFYTWTNRATHKILQSNGKGAQLTTATRPGKTSGRQQWAFTH